MGHYVDTIALRKKGSWHGMENLPTSGGIFNGDTTIVAQMEASNMLFTVEKVQPQFNFTDGTFMVASNSYGLIREPVVWDNERRLLRKAVGNRYVPFQNIELATLFEPIQRSWPLESVISMKLGKITVIEMALDPFDVAGYESEKHKTFLLVVNNHEAGSLQIGLTVVRVVCNNTYRLALSQDAKTMASVPHSGDPKMEMAFRAAVIEQTIRRREQEQEILNRMFTTPVNKEGLADIIEAAYPDPPKGRRLKLIEGMEEDEIPQGNDIVEEFLNKATDERGLFEVAMERVKKQREQVADSFIRFGEEVPAAAGTLYAAFNAVTHETNHSDLYTGGRDKALVSLVSGQRNKSNQDAYRKAVALL